MKKNITEFEWPKVKSPVHMDLPGGMSMPCEKIKDKRFLGMSLSSVADTAGMKSLPEAAKEMKSVYDLMLWLSRGAQAWTPIRKEITIGESTMDIRAIIRKVINEELAKYKKSNIEFKKTGKETPKSSIDRDLKKEDETKLNVIQDKQDADRKKDGASGVPTDKEWKRFRNAEEVEASAQPDDVQDAHEKLIKKLDDELEEMRNLSQKIDDKTLCDLVTEVESTHFTNYNENRNRYKFIRLQNAMRPVAARLKSAKDYSDKDKASDIEKLNKLVEKYLRVEIKKKFDTETERNEEQEKEFSKSIK